MKTETKKLSTISMLMRQKDLKQLILILEIIQYHQQLKKTP